MDDEENGTDEDVKVQRSKSQCKKSRLKNKKPKKKKCIGRTKWDCNTDPLWRIYLKTLTEDGRDRTQEEKDRCGLFESERKKPEFIPPPFDVSTSITPLKCLRLNALNTDNKKFWNEKTRIWDDMKDPSQCLEPPPVTTCTFEWPKIWPCCQRDEVKEKKILARKMKMKMMGASPCEIEEIDSPGTSEDEMLQEMANLKELVHAKIPITHSKKKDILLVDRASGENPGLVSGEYVICELASKRDERTYANVCLQGLTGMHLVELERTRVKTWKFCLFQGLVALLAKTQFRYKYLWSANIDYIYEHAWMLFLHIGLLNIKSNQRFDDVLVYNYKYNVELELVHELKDVPIVKDVPFHFVEKTFKRQRQYPRKELTLTKSTFGSERTKDDYRSPVHKGTRRIEKWFDDLEIQYTNCILRTPRFSVAFWQDGSFWYLYNPYRCDKFGFWNDEGFANIMKFCTKDSLKRHIMVLILRAYAYESNPRKKIDSEMSRSNATTRSVASTKKKDNFTIQIFQLIYHSCKIYNVKLYQRTPRLPKPQLIEKKKSDPCTFDPLASLTPKPCGNSTDKSDDDDDNEDTKKIEKSSWLEGATIPWSKIKKDDNEESNKDPEKWHKYDVIEPRRLFILWGEIHITDQIFPLANRNKQAGACYVVCAGMSLVNAAEYWTDEILNAIVVCGDKFYSKRRSKIQQSSNCPNDPDAWDTKPNDQFRIGDMLFDFAAHPAINGRLFLRTDENLWQTLERFFHSHLFGILKCESAQFGVFKHCSAYYAMDVKSYGPPIFEHCHGSVYLLRATCLVDLVKSLILVIGSPECSDFTLRPIEITNVVDVSDENQCEKKKMKKAGGCGDDNGEIFKPACPSDDDKKKNKKRVRRSASRGEKKDFDKKTCSKRCH